MKLSDAIRNKEKHMITMDKCTKFFSYPFNSIKRVRHFYNLCTKLDMLSYALLIKPLHRYDGTIVASFTLMATKASTPNKIPDTLYKRMYRFIQFYWYKEEYPPLILSDNKTEVESITIGWYGKTFRSIEAYHQYASNVQQMTSFDWHSRIIVLTDDL